MLLPEQYLGSPNVRVPLTSYSNRNSCITNNSSESGGVDRNEGTNSTTGNRGSAETSFNAVTKRYCSDIVKHVGKQMLMWEI